MMMIPEAWQKNELMPENKRAFYEYHSCLMEPWDGPASIAFTDGKYIGAVLDRNGLAAEPLLPHARRPRDHGERGRRRADRSRERESQGPSRARPHVPDRFRARPAGARRRAQERVREPPAVRASGSRRTVSRYARSPRETTAPEPSIARTLMPRMQAFGYTIETLHFMLQPMVREHRDPVGSMGNDSTLAVLIRQAADALRLFPAAVRAGD